MWARLLRSAVRSATRCQGARIVLGIVRAFLSAMKLSLFMSFSRDSLVPVEAIARAAPVASSAAQACSRLRLARARGEHDDRLSQKDVDEQVGKRLIRGVRLLSCFGFCRERHD